MELERISVGLSPREQFGRLTGRVRYGDGTCEDLWFEFPAELLDRIDRSGNPWLTALAPLAMTIREPLRIPLPVDPVLDQGIRSAADRWRQWQPSLAPLAVDAPIEAGDRPPTGNRVGSLFSGGVDSWYTLVTNHAEADGVALPRIDTLVLVGGADLGLDNQHALRAVEASIVRAADRAGCTSLALATNLRTTRWGLTDWAGLSHGAFFASAIHAAGIFRACFVAASVTEDYDSAWGSHPRTDPLLSTTRTRIIPHAAEVNRMEKIGLLCQTPEILDSVRVCWRSGSEANCGRCGKCQRTMFGLEVHGALRSSRAFPSTRLDPTRVARLQVDNPLRRIQLQQMEAAADQAGRQDLADACRRAVRRGAWLARAGNVLGKLDRAGIRGAHRLWCWLDRDTVRE